MSKYKTFEELKEELGNEFDEYLYKSNIELLTKIDKAIEYINSLWLDKDGLVLNIRERLYFILRGEDK